MARTALILRLTRESLFSRDAATSVFNDHAELGAKGRGKRFKTKLRSRQEWMLAHITLMRLGGRALDQHQIRSAQAALGNIIVSHENATVLRPGDG